MEKSGEDGQWSGLRDIMMLVCGGISGGWDFFNYLRFDVREGSRVRFWTNV